MDYAAVLAALDNASGFELYRLRAAIERVLDEPRWIRAIGARLRVGQRVEFFDVRANGARNGQVLELRRKNVVVLEDESRQRWLIDYAAINLDGADVAIRQRTQKGLGRLELSAGETVGFVDHEGRERSGKLVRLNDKTVTLDCNGQKWRVAYALLHRVVEGDASTIELGGLIGKG